MKRRSDVVGVGTTDGALAVAALAVAALAVAGAGPATLLSGMLRGCASC